MNKNGTIGMAYRMLAILEPKPDSRKQRFISEYLLKHSRRGASDIEQSLLIKEATKLYKKIRKAAETNPYLKHLDK